MSFMTIRYKYIDLRSKAQKDTHEYKAYDQILTQMSQAHSLADAHEAIEALLKGSLDSTTQGIYEQFMQEKLHYANIEQIKQDNKRAGEDWFNPKEMRKFGSRVGEKIYGGRYFISSEKDHHDNPRTWTIRTISEGGVIHTVGERMGYGSWGAADRDATKVANSETLDS